jgi:[ribosomal protein S5]-alanine N-acetyltransferase
MRMPALRTNRLVIREFGMDDLEAVHTLLDVQLEGGLATLEQRRDWLRWTVLGYAQLAELRQPPYGDRAIVLTSSGALIGACGLVPCLAPFSQIPGMGERPGYSAEMGLYWAVAPEHQRRGYATEAGRALVQYAFDTLRVHRVVATTSFDNAASMAVMHKLGMRLERNPRREPEWFQVVGVLPNPTVP